jgi:hypothetical protein
VLQQELGVRVHLAHPSGLHWGQRRRKDDERDARDLADMLRLGRLPEAWIAPRPVVSCVSWCVTEPSWCACGRG